MDGFTSIPIQNSTAGNGGGGMSGFGSVPNISGSTGSISDSTSRSNNSTNYNSGTQYAETLYKDNAISGNDGIEIVDENKKKKEGNGFSFLFPLSVLTLFGVFGYFGYLVFVRYITLEKVAILSDDFQVLAKGINKNELEEFIALDNSLKAINQKLGNHTQLAGILGFVNKNIRSAVQITDYRIESREKEVSVSLLSIAPTFRELAEQTEKMTELKQTGAIKNFIVNQMSLENDGRRIRYTLNLIFDKSNISVGALAAQNTIQNTNDIENN